MILQRIVGRQHRYTPPSLLQSQFDSLEEPDADEQPETGWTEREEGWG